MPLGALVRTLGELTFVGLLAPISETASEAAVRLTYPAEIRRGCLHPLKIVVAIMTHRQGYGARGNLNWTPVPLIIDVLE